MKDCSAEFDVFAGLELPFPKPTPGEVPPVPVNDGALGRRNYSVSSHKRKISKSFPSAQVQDSFVLGMPAYLSVFAAVSARRQAAFACSQDAVFETRSAG